MPGNASRVARALRTISSNLSQFNEEGEDNLQVVSALQEQWEKIGTTTGKNISLYDEQTGQLKNTYDILYDLHSVWPLLNKDQQNYIAELISGKNNLDVFNAILQNFNTAISANETAMNSAGSAAKENAAYMESLEAKVSALKQTFQELSTSLIDDDVAGILLDITNSLLQMVNTPVGRILAIGTAFTTVAFAASSLWKAMDIGTKFAGFLTGGAGLAGGLAAINLPLVAILATVTALVAFSPQIIDFFDSVQNPIENSTKKLEANAVQLEENRKRLKELEEIPWYDRTPEINKEIEELKKYNAELEKSNEALIQRRANAAYNEITQDRQTTRNSFDVYSGGSMVQQGLGSVREVLSWIENASGEVYKNLEEARQAGWDIAEGLAYGIESAEDYYKRIIIQQRQFNADIANGKTLTAEENATYQENNRQLAMLVNNKELAVNATQELDDVYNKYAVSATKVLNKSDELTKGLKEQTRTQEIVADGFQITQEAAEKLIAANPELAKSVANVNDAFYMEKQSLYDLAAAGNTVAQQMIKDQIALTEVAIEKTKERIQLLIDEKRAYMQAAMTDVSSGNFFYLGVNKEELKAEQDILANQVAELEKIKSSIKSWPKNNPLSTGSKDKDKGSKKEKDILEDLKKQLSEMAHQAFLLDKQDAEANADAIVQIYKQMQEAVHAKAEELRKADPVKNKEAIIELQKLWWGYSDEIKKVYDQIATTQKKFLDESEKALKAHLEAESARYKKLADQQQEIRDGYQDQADAYKIYANFVKESIDEQIKVYQKEIDALEKANEERENEIALQEKLNNLAKAKSTQVMVYKDGKFQYTNDIDAVSSAQNDLNEYQRERQLEKEKQYWQDKIDALEKYKDEWNNFTKDYEDSANMQLLIQSGLFTAEDLIFSNRIKSAQNFADKYTEAMNRAMEAAKRMEEYQKLAAKYAESASNIGGSGTDWSQAWRDVDAAQKAGAISNAEAEALKQYYHSEKTKEMEGTGATFNPGTGTWTNPSGGSGSGSSSSGKGVVGKNSAIYGRANGTLSDDGGIKLVGEEGPEIRVLNKGDGVIPADVTKNLWALGSNPYAFMSNVYKSLAGTGSGNSTMYSFAIDKLELPHATDGASVFEGLRNYAHQRASQRV